MPLADGDADGSGSGDAATTVVAVAATAAGVGGGRSGRRDCNIGQRLHSCFKLDLLKSFRRATPTGANWDGKYIFYRTFVYIVHSLFSLLFALTSCPPSAYYARR